MLCFVSPCSSSSARHDSAGVLSTEIISRLNRYLTGTVRLPNTMPKQTSFENTGIAVCGRILSIRTDNK